MIQRQQTLWLLLATLCAFLTFQFPVFTGTAIDPPHDFTVVDGGKSLFLILATGASLIISFVTIFFFKDRPTQIKLCWLGILVSILVLLFYYLEIKKLTGTLALWAVFPIIIPIAYFMAFRGIRRDQKLVKSLDKLR